STLAYSCTSKIALVHSSSLSSLQITDDGKQDSASRKQPADCKKISNPKGSPLHPYFVTGFCDGEGCFHVRICKKKGYKSGYRITPLFSIR
ncbi:LAGLIDADG family homing endonuclease, partial [Pseudomonas aeruginosa]|uniref:LAGLIDADG family homing endonuclease n=1 Tax=Pseudomonas aeruginosa TaxID=287 RepID=UPI0039783FED